MKLLVVFALPELWSNDSLFNLTTVYPGLSQIVFAVVAPSNSNLDMPARTASFKAELSHSGYPYWMSDGENFDVPLKAAVIGCRLRANHAEVNVTKDGLLLT